MKNRDKTKNQLIHEVAELNQRIAELEKLEAKHNQTEEALRESEEKYRELIKGMNDTAWVIDFNGNFIDVNDAAVKVFGYSREELLSMGPRNIDSSLDVKEIDSLIKGMPTDKLQVFETTHITKNGKAIPVEIKSSLMTYQGKRAILSIARDITGRKRAEQILRESEEKYRNLVERANDGIVIGQDGIIRYANPRSAHMGGYTIEELTGAPIFDFFFSEERAKLIDRYRRRLAGEDVPPVYESALKHKDGSRIEVEINAGVISYNGKPADLVLFRDITERKQAEEALRESEERFRLAFENANTGVCLVDLEGNLTKVNNKMCEIFGYTKEELERMTVNNIAHPEDMDKSPAFIQRTLRGETDQGTFEKRYLHKKGHVVTCQVSSSLVRNADGFPLYFISHVHDITERKRAEEALREKQETINAIIETSQDWIWIIDSQGVHRYSNPAVEKILGYRAEEIVGGVSLDLMHEEDKKMVESMLPEWRGKKCGWSNLLLRWRHKNGTYRYLESNAVPILNSKGDLIGFQGVDRDITERKQAEELLQKEREISLSILENAPYGVALIDEGGKYIYINPEFTNITGYTLEDIPTGKDWFRKAFPDLKDRGRVIQVWKEDRSKGSMIIREFSIICKDGKIKEIEIRSTFLQDGRVVIVLHDITEQKRAQEKMESLQEQLRQSQKMEAIGRLAGGVAHDFNNLLTIIKGYSQLSLIELKEDSPLKKNIEHIHEATDRAANLVRQLLAFSRRQILEMKVLDLNAILTNLDNMLRRVIGEDIELTTILAEDLGRVKTDPGWIEQAIMNLVVNSRDAMPSGGKLTIETGNADLDEASTYGHFDVEPGRYVMLSVSDTGVGITPEVMERLFEPFFSTKEKDKGTGLGLSMAYGIVKQCGGDIWVYGEPGKGATFKIYLPRVDEPLEERREKVLGDEFLRGSETILLVEDEENVRKLTLRILERHGYKVLSARDGDDALLICEQFKDPIHLMLTDVVMPRMSGHELAKHLKSSHPKMKVLYMSGYTDNTIVLHGVLMEGVDFIQKPFTVDALTKKIREVLEQ